MFDADTGAFKRMWGAFGNPPLDDVPAKPKVPENQRIPAKEETGPGPLQFERPVHAARVSNDGLVYVSDRGGRRVQVFTLDGKSLSSCKRFIDRYWVRCAMVRQRAGTVASTAFSPDPEQKFLLRRESRSSGARLVDPRPQRRFHPFLDSFPGATGIAPGEFLRDAPHERGHKGQPCTSPRSRTESASRKFVFKGMKNVPVN